MPNVKFTDEALLFLSRNLTLSADLAVIEYSSRELLRVALNGAANSTERLIFELSAVDESTGHVELIAGGIRGMNTNTIANRTLDHNGPTRH